MERFFQNWMTTANIVANVSYLITWQSEIGLMTHYRCWMKTIFQRRKLLKILKLSQSIHEFLLLCHKTHFLLFCNKVFEIDYNIFCHHSTLRKSPTSWSVSRELYHTNTKMCQATNWITSLLCCSLCWYQNLIMLSH